jgi:hypothetical protein
MNKKKTHTHELKSIVIKEEGTTWGIVFYDNVKHKTIEKELKRQLKKAMNNEV